MVSRGVVRGWSDEEGSGVVDSVDTPGGCWVHFSNVAVAGYQSLTPGRGVELDWVTGGQDGYGYRALRVWPTGSAPVAAAPSSDSGMSSSLTIEWETPPSADH